jgi:integrase
VRVTFTLFLALVLENSPTLGPSPLHEITPELIGAWQAAELRRKRGREQIRKAHTLLGNILQRAVEARRIPSNPQRLVRKVKPAPKRRVIALAPASVEAIRVAILDGRTKSSAPYRDATLISVMAYAGLRPSEPFALRWRDVGDRTLYVAANKNIGRATEERWVRLLAALAQDLREWRLASGRPKPGAFVFPAADGGRWSDEARKSWSRRTFAQAVKAAKVEHLPPKDLRHAFASLLAHEGRSGPYIADQLGHGLEVSQSTYQHILRELEDQPRVSAEDAIRAARQRPREAAIPASGTD